jgi:predicted AAA+ superfamily ATPase
VISLLSDKKTLDKGTVIFIDDVERLPNLITLIKLLVIDSTYRYVLSGALLGLELIHIDSIPVGYAEYHILYPIDFEEFLLASKVNEKTIKYVVDCIKDKIEISYPLYLTLSDLFNTYLTIGGMPSIVR